MTGNQYSLEFVGAKLLVNNLPDDFVRHDGQEIGQPKKVVEPGAYAADV